VAFREHEKILKNLKNRLTESSEHGIMDFRPRHWRSRPASNIVKYFFKFSNKNFNFKK